MLRGEKKNDSFPLLKRTNKQGWRQELPNNKWPNMNKEITPSRLLTGDKVTELRN
jgi:hypothetical protein